MESVLLLLICILYAEMSLCKITRAVARILYYTHTLAIIAPLYAVGPFWGLVHGMLIYLFGFIFCMSFSETTQGRVLFGVLAFLTFFIYYSAITKSLLDLVVFGYSVMAHSDTIFKWCFLMALGSCASLLDRDYTIQQRDVELTVGSFFLMWVAGSL